jgi:glycosyltransferase involved in cell wall biosynthesis
MATGNPLITSKLGEICNYCEEGKNVFFVTPDNITELSDKMIYVLEYPEKAEEIGTSGKLLANSVFDNKQQSKILLNFMRSFRGDSETSC